MDERGILPRHTDQGRTTRGHQFKLLKRECRGQIRANFFGMRIVNKWNSLPAEVVEVPTVNCFKGRFDRWHGEECYGLEGKREDEIEYRYPGTEG